MAGIWLKSLKQVKRAIIGVIGFTLLGLGLIMIVLPGPALVVIPLALGVLATEFIWARNLIQKVKTKFSTDKHTSGNNPGTGSDSCP